jgi:flagellar biosynthesis/type III secretory pathway M-ring protein FliF/YscJ
MTDMGPAVELFILLLFALVVAIGGAVFVMRPFWKRAAKSVLETDRRERDALEAQARERAEEAECRRRAEEELQRSLAGLDHANGSHDGQRPISRRPAIPREEQAATNVQTENVETEERQ